MATDKIDTLDIYTRHAAGYDRSRDKSLFERPWLERFCAQLPQGASILDAGCGSGRPIAEYLIARNYAVTGVDYAEPMIQLAAGRFPEASWHVADIRILDLPTQFDGIIAWHSFFHLTPDEQREALPQLAGHLLSTGIFMMTIGPDAEDETTGFVEGERVYHASLREADYRELLEKADMEGISIVRDDESCGGASVLMARKKQAIS